ncbi:hypothetical protein PUN28_017204 [Cardiocondyla obscurior]|uniref:Uncharacterized protein n=1 Tax=Cardiocondyla obscurior TaxID=286306 RepID=A0AAW2EQ00_9HYME
MFIVRFYLKVFTSINRQMSTLNGILFRRDHELPMESGILSLRNRYPESVVCPRNWDGKPVFLYLISSSVGRNKIERSTSKSKNKHAPSCFAAERILRKNDRHRVPQCLQ